MKRCAKAFTLIELLVVVAIIALLIAILLPSLGKAKQLAVTAKCLSNLRQNTMAFNMYANDYNQCLPYPTTTVITGQTSITSLWFNAVDPYLEALVNTSRGGVAGARSYQKYKQCPVLDGILGDKTSYGQAGTVNQNLTTEAARSFKMNSMLRRNNVAPTPPSTSTYAPARLSMVPNPSTFVAIGDGISMDTVGNALENATTAQVDNAQFSMEVNSTTASATPPSLRHGGGACMAFVDGHAERLILPLLTPAVPLANTPNTPIDRWQSEYLNGGAQYNPPVGATSLPAGVVRNPAMPLIWSDVGNLYR